jgi:hypothetical protein
MDPFLLKKLATALVLPRFGITTPLDLLPSMGALQGSQGALYELLANAMRGW